MTTTLYGAPPACYRQLQEEAFPYQRVVQAFDAANITNTSWAYLYSQLQTAKRQIPDMVRREADKLSPNPLNDPFQPELAVELLRRVEYTVFFNVMNATQYNIISDINQMFAFIFQTHASKIYQCLGVDIIKQRNVPD